MIFNIDARGGEEVYESALLDEVVLAVDTHVLNLLLGWHEPLHLGLLSSVSPLRDKLLSLVASVHIVEVSELGTDEEGEVSQLGHADVERDDVLVVEYHGAEPLVVGPGAHAREGGDRSDVEEHEDEAAAGARERLVVGRDLLGANSFEQSLHVVVIAEGDGVLSGVVWVLISLLHLRELVCIVALTILSLVTGFLPKLMKQ